MAPIKDRTGFLGNSSYSAIFADANDNLDTGLNEGLAQDIISLPESPLGADKIAKGAQLLSLFCELETWERFLEREFAIAGK